MMIGSREYNVLNSRRCELIHRHVYQENLTVEEKTELDTLQETIREIVNKKYPRPPLPDLDLEQLRAELEEKAMSPDAARAILLDRIDYNASRYLISARDKAILVGLRGYVAGLTTPEMVKLAGYLPSNMATMDATDQTTAGESKPE